MAVKNVVAMFADRLGVLDAYGWCRRSLTKSQVAIVMYHRVTPERERWSLVDSVSPEEFEWQMEYFRSNFEILSLEELAQYLHEFKALPKKAAVITFDDGYRDNYVHAFPILAVKNIPATIFLTTGYVDSDALPWWDTVGYGFARTLKETLHHELLGSYRLRNDSEKITAALQVVNKLKKLSDDVRRELVADLEAWLEVRPEEGLGRELFLSWDEVREMDSFGIDFGAHTVTHPILTQIPLAEAEGEIIHSKEDIEKHLSKPVNSFSYPNGDFNGMIAEVVKDAGFSCAVSIMPRKLIDSKDDPYGLSRMGMCGFSKFKVMLSGLWGDLAKWV